MRIVATDGDLAIQQHAGGLLVIDLECGCEVRGHPRGKGWTAYGFPWDYLTRHTLAVSDDCQTYQAFADAARRFIGNHRPCSLGFHSPNATQ